MQEVCWFIKLPTMVVSAMEPKLLMKMLQETLTGGPAMKDKGGEQNHKYKYRYIFKETSEFLTPAGKEPHV